MHSSIKTQFAVGEHLFNQGDEGGYAFIIEHGQVEIYIPRAAKKMVLATLSDGELVGEMAIIDKLPRTASAVALKDTQVIAIPRDYVAQKIEFADPTVRFFLKVVMERYRDLNQRLTQVFEGLNPDDSSENEGEDSASTRNVMKQLMHQYMDMQQRIMDAVTQPPELETRQREDDDASSTKLSLNIEKALQAALNNHEFRLFYQPIMNLQTGRVAGCEALVRWQHPERGLLGPFEFIEHAEKTGLIVALGYWITQEACRFQADRAREYDANFFTSINVSGKQFEDPHLVERLSEIVLNSGVEPKRIKFEITESILMSDPELAEEALEKLKRCGVKLSIDDFGTGYSSLSYLHRFPFDTLKVDRSFVSTMVQNRKSREIVKSLVDLSHNLTMTVVAEGIETTFEEQEIKAYNAEYGQGFLYSKPLPEAEFVALLEAQAKAD